MIKAGYMREPPSIRKCRGLASLATAKIFRCGQSAGKSLLTPQRLHAGLSLSTHSITANAIDAPTVPRMFSIVSTTLDAPIVITTPIAVTTSTSSSSQPCPMEIQMAGPTNRDQTRNIMTRYRSLSLITATIVVKVMAKLSLTMTKVTTTSGLPHDHRKRHSKVPQLTPELQFLASSICSNGLSVLLPSLLLQAISILEVVPTVVGLLVEAHNLSLNVKSKDTMSRDEDIVQSWRRRQVANCFKANSAILNSLLALINERVFHNDNVPTACPLVSMFGASNELPEGKELEALFDRFLLRYDVNYILQPSNLRQVLLAPEPTSTIRLTIADLRKIQAQVAKVTINDETVDALISVREACRTEGIISSDRRWKKSLKLAQAAAYLIGDPETSPEDLSILADSLWRETKDRFRVTRMVGRLCDPAGAQAVEILDGARETAQKIAGMKFKDHRQYVQEGASALQDFNSQLAKLSDLEKTCGKRAKLSVADATTKIQLMRDEIAKVVHAKLGLKAPK